MTSVIYSLLSVPLVALAIVQPSAQELQYQGTLTRQGRDADAAPLKRFDVFALVAPTSDGRTGLSFLVDERGGSGWAWPERYGLIELDKHLRPANKSRIRLLHEHQGTLHPIALRQPLFEFTDKLAAGASWIDGRNEYEVRRSLQVGERHCWHVDVSTDFGRTETLHIEKETGLLVAFEQRIFMGQGDEFLLKAALDSSKPVSDERLAALRKPLTTMLRLKQDLGRDDSETKPELSSEQLDATRKVVDQLGKEAEATPFSRLSSVISRDVQAQAQRAGDLENLAKKFVGSAAPQFTFKSIDQTVIDSKALAGKITVLHFWDYQADPFAEPYGQVGYLDYLYNHRRKLGVTVVGVAVNSLLEENDKSPLAVRSIRKLKEFMNLSYPLATDSGSEIKKFGDPRQLGAKLPLWMVIAPDGTIAHYHVGFYQINPDQGLRELDEVVVKLIKKDKPE